jgi:hypothetical protein
MWSQTPQHNATDVLTVTPSSWLQTGVTSSRNAVVRASREDGSERAYLVRLLCALRSIVMLHDALQPSGRNVGVAGTETVIDHSLRQSHILGGCGAKRLGGMYHGGASAHNRRRCGRNRGEEIEWAAVKAVWWAE